MTLFEQAASRTLYRGQSLGHLGKRDSRSFADSLELFRILFEAESGMANANLRKIKLLDFIDLLSMIIAIFSLIVFCVLVTAGVFRDFAIASGCLAFFTEGLNLLINRQRKIAHKALAGELAALRDAYCSLVTIEFCKKNSLENLVESTLSRLNASEINIPPEAIVPESHFTHEK